MSIAENIAAVRERIAVAARRAGRDPDDIALMAVCKTKPRRRDSRRLRSRTAPFRREPSAGVPRKVRRSAGPDDLARTPPNSISSVTCNRTRPTGPPRYSKPSIPSIPCRPGAPPRRRLAPEQTLPILIEINIGGEDQKAGLAPDSHDLEQILQAAPSLLAISIRGLMTVPPFTDDPEGARPYFRRLREFRDQIAARKLPAVAWKSCRWACPTTLKSPSKKVRPVFASEPQFSEQETTHEEDRHRSGLADGPARSSPLRSRMDFHQRLSRRRTVGLCGWRRHHRSRPSEPRPPGFWQGPRSHGFHRRQHPRDRSHPVGWIHAGHPPCASPSFPPHRSAGDCRTYLLVCKG